MSAKGEAYIGLTMENLRPQKDKFIESLLPKWRQGDKATEAESK
jgi:formate-dependent nitrite reductase cytochrome c552 subunit